MTQRVFVDANVLFSRTLRDWLFQLRNAAPEMFQLHSTEDVLAETLYRLRRKNPAWDGGQITRLRESLVENLDEILTDFDATVAYDGSDPNDRHVHAAAVSCSADILLTNDTGFVSLEDADRLPYEVQSADEFFVLIDNSAASYVQRVTDSQRRYWASSKSAGSRGLAEALVASGCPEFAKRVTIHLRTLSGPTAGGPKVRRPRTKK